MRPGFRAIAAAVCRETGVKKEELLSAVRTRHIAHARQLLWHIARELRPDLSLPRLGTMTGGRDHTTALHGIHMTERRLAASAELRDCRARIVERIMSAEVLEPPAPVIEPAPPPPPERTEPVDDPFDAPVMGHDGGRAMSRVDLELQNRRFAAAMREAMT